MNEHESSDADDPRRFATGYHAPVLSRAVVEGLVTDRSGVYIDATLGGGGHSAAILRELSDEGIVVGIDQDIAAIDAAKARLVGEAGARFHAVRGNFADLRSLLLAEGFRTVTGILLDLGVSSHQIDESARGFSFSAEGPLDMRMDDRRKRSAADLLNTLDESEIRALLYEFGEERRAPRIAREIVSRRPLSTTTDLANTVRAVVPGREEVKTLAKVFQAVRIAVNRELDALEEVLAQSVDLLQHGGRIAVISYHSLEDRRVKYFLRYGNFEGKPVRDFYGNLVTPWKEITRKPTRPGNSEIAANPRARSARLRIAERVRQDEQTSTQSGLSYNI